MMLRLFLYFFLLVMLSTAGPAWSQVVEPVAEMESLLAKEEISWPDLVRLAELTNPDLSAAQHLVKSEAARAHQAGAYPNPTLGLDIGEMSTRDTDDRKEKISLVQPLVIGGRRSAAVQMAKADHEAAINEALLVRRQVLVRLRTLWLEELHYREAEAAYGELLDLANRSLHLAQKRFDKRAIPESQVTRALLDVYELEVGQQNLALQKVHVQTQLKVILGGASIPVERLTCLDADQLLDDELLGPQGMASESGQYLGNHPAFLAAHRTVESAEASLDQARAQRLPDVDVFLAYGRNRGADENFVEAGISLPLPLFDRSQGLIASRQSQVSRAQAQALRVDQQLQSELVLAQHKYQAIRAQLEVSVNRILPAAERGLEQAQTGYGVGRVPFLELMDAQRLHASARLRSIELHRETAMAKAQLMSLAGLGLYGN